MFKNSGHGRERDQIFVACSDTVEKEGRNGVKRDRNDTAAAASAGGAGVSFVAGAAVVLSSVNVAMAKGTLTEKGRNGIRRGAKRRKRVEEEDEDVCVCEREGLWWWWWWWGSNGGEAVGFEWIDSDGKSVAKRKLPMPARYAQVAR